MQETTLTVEIKVSDDNSHLEIVNPSTTEPICALILMGIFKSMGDFAEEWNKEHRKQKDYETRNNIHSAEKYNTIARRRQL